MQQDLRELLGEGFVLEEPLCTEGSWISKINIAAWNKVVGGGINQDWQMHVGKQELIGKGYAVFNPEQYLSGDKVCRIAMPIVKEEQSQGEILFLFPEDPFLQPLNNDDAGAVGDESGQNGREILLVTNNLPEAERIQAALSEYGLTFVTIDFGESIQDALTDQVRGVLLISEKVSEQTMGVVVKIASATPLPLIAAGPDWTKSKVVKAVKYGVLDILLTPASSEDICAKVETHFGLSPI
ncbi:MAG: hypothetical protein H8E79_01290 [Desulfobulbaceae bacterium]|uniref:Response regulatory domain-containing protein n=1 Tax=Candidatus Desulfatifera sulfidica TaxID=2841691 RepID=A0A8J6TCZ2_9BACT|nr:hypothetical protein [Candidatus Desulfatifera sulfidica]